MSNVQVTMSLKYWNRVNNRHVGRIRDLESKVLDLSGECEILNKRISGFDAAIDMKDQQIANQAKHITRLAAESEKYLQELRGADVIISGHVETIKKLEERLRPKRLFDICRVILEPYTHRLIDKMCETEMVYDVRAKNVIDYIRFMFRLYGEGIVSFAECGPKMAEYKYQLVYENEINLGILRELRCKLEEHL